MELYQYTAKELGQKLRAGECSARELLQSVFGLLLLLGDGLQLLTSFIVLEQQFSGGIRQSDFGLRHTAGKSLGEEPRRRSGTVQRRGRKVLNMPPKGGFQFNQHGDQFLVAFDQLPAEGIAADQHGDIGGFVPGDFQIVLDLEHIFGGNRVLPLPSLVSGGGLGFEYTGPKIGVLAHPIQIRQHERVLLALKKLPDQFDLQAGPLDKLSPDKGFQLRSPVCGFPGLLHGDLIRLFHPQFHGGLITADAAHHRGVRPANAQLPVLQPILIGKVLG